LQREALAEEPLKTLFGFGLHKVCDQVNNGEDLTFQTRNPQEHKLQLISTNFRQLFENIETGLERTALH